MPKEENDFLEEKTRAEDILLGGLGFGEEARIREVRFEDDRFSGVGEWEDGEPFDFESDDEMSELEKWAVSVLLEHQRKKVSNA